MRRLLEWLSPAHGKRPVMAPGANRPQNGHGEPVEPPCKPRQSGQHEADCPTVRLSSVRHGAPVYDEPRSTRPYAGGDYWHGGPLEQPTWIPGHHPPHPDTLRARARKAYRRAVLLANSFGVELPPRRIHGVRLSGGAL
ncbi:hypothetical protein [Streptomyces aidingensis]|uniref:Uncharacterized protein n=1 Tax=Streptomyces aidingensis TaxID=910347 RepID=A0A1I1R749_9ACTN|nr:hypothetical protein [Streptomyces aidingensis]SFD26120.1 hypothetical protein SAMN05421773_11231 [Streptomyces aidingensis]